MSKYNVKTLKLWGKRQRKRLEFCFSQLLQVSSMSAQFVNQLQSWLLIHLLLLLLLLFILFSFQVTTQTGSRQVSYIYCMAFYDMLQNLQLIQLMFKDATANRKFQELTKGTFDCLHRPTTSLPPPLMSSYGYAALPLHLHRHCWHYMTHQQ